MRFMVIVKATALSESGTNPSADMLEAMGAFNKEMVDAGIMLTGEGLKASSYGARISFAAGDPIVTDGPFAETKELVGGFWLLSVKSKDDAIAWMRRAPMQPGDELEIRPLLELDDFADIMTPEHVARVQALRARAGKSE